MNPTTFIFDLDGTLIDSLVDLASATNQVLTEHQLPVHPLEDYRTLVGDGVRVLFQRAIPTSHSHDESLLDSCIAAFHRCYERQWDQNTRPYDGIPAALTALREKGLALAVLSNKPHPFTVACVDRFFPDISFEVVLGNLPEIARKPDPAGVHAIAGRLNTSCDQIAYLGDTNTDMQTAVAAGCLPVGVTWGFRSEEELRNAGAEQILHHPNEIVKICDA